MIAMAKQTESPKPKRSVGKTDKIRVAVDIHAAIHFVAACRDVDVAELVDPLLRQWAMTEQAIESKKLAERNKPRGDSKN